MNDYYPFDFEATPIEFYYGGKASPNFGKFFGYNVFFKDVIFFMGNSVYDSLLEVIQKSKKWKFFIEDGLFVCEYQTENPNGIFRFETKMHTPKQFGYWYENANPLEFVSFEVKAVLVQVSFLDMV